MLFGLLLILIIYILIEISKGQELRPALVVSNKAGAINSEQVFIGFMGCNESSTSDLKEIINRQNKTIQELVKRVEQHDQFIASLSNRTGIQLLQNDQITSTPNNCECSSSAKNGIFIDPFSFIQYLTEFLNFKK